MMHDKSRRACVSALPGPRLASRQAAIALVTVAAVTIPWHRGFAQQDAGGSTPAASSTSAPSSSSSSSELVEPSLEGSGGAPSQPAVGSTEIPEAAPFAQDASGTFDFRSGFRGDCDAADIAGGVMAGAAAPLPILSGPPRNGSRYFQASLRASETFTDNLNREPSDQADSDFITEISPRFDACASSGRVQGLLSWSPQFVLYAHNSQYNDIYNTVLGQGTVNILPGHLYLDADTRYGQTIVDPSISYSQSNSLSPGNQTATWTTNISPYAVQSLGALGTASLRYRYGRVLHNDNDVPDSTINGGYFNLTSPADSGRLSWRADAQTQKVETDGGNPVRFFRGFGINDSNQPLFDANGQINPDRLEPVFGDAVTRDRTRYFDRASAELDLQATRLITLIAIGGVEDEYQADGSNDRWSAPFYSGGVRLGGAQNTIEARVGHHFYGTSYYLSAWHRGDFLDASIAYNEQPSSTGLNALNNNGRTGSIPGAALGVPVESQFDRGVYLEKRWSGQVSFNLPRSTTGLTVYRRKRDYLEGNQDNDIYNGASLQVDYQLGPRTSLIPEVSWQNREGNGDNARFGGGYDNYDIGATVARAISPTSQAAIGYTHAWRNGDRPDSDYRENRATIQYLKNF